MALSAFSDKDSKPDDQSLEVVLGDANEAWKALIAHIESTYSPVTEDWGFAGKKWGWSLRLKQKKRTILYLTPSDGLFYVGFVLGDRALNLARERDLPDWVRTIIDNAPKYGEGTGFRLEIRETSEIAALEKIAEAKMAK